jgi:hypothetical protein
VARERARVTARHLPHCTAFGGTSV